MTFRMTKMQNTNNQISAKMRKNKLLFITDENVLVQTLWKTIWKFHMKWNIFLTYHLQLSFVVYLKELKTCVPKTLHVDVTAVLLIIAKTWKQPKYSSACEWIINCGTSRQWNSIHHWKEISYQAIQRYGKKWNAYY